MVYPPVFVAHTQNSREVVYSSRRAQSGMAQHQPRKQQRENAYSLLRDYRCLTVLGSVTAADLVVCWFRHFGFC